MYLMWEFAGTAASREVLREIFSDARGSGIDIVSFVKFHLFIWISLSSLDRCDTTDVIDILFTIDLETKNYAAACLFADRKLYGGLSVPLVLF